MTNLRLPGPADLERLRSRVGADRVSTRPETLDRYARDESTCLEAQPTALARPRSAEEVCEVLRWASEGPFAVIPRGAGTGVTGASLAVGGGLVLSLERLDHILEIDEDNLTLTCEPGCVTAHIHETVEARGLFYPPDPASLESCSIGGNVTVGAGGARAVKYGTTREYLLGLQVALADGTLLDLGGKNVKNASGFHLMDLLVGSEGTLGIVTAITVRLLPLPSLRVVLLLPFTELAGATRTVSRVLRERIVPSVAEFMDDVTIDAARRYLGRDLPGGEGVGAYAILELDGEDQSLLEKQMLQVGAIAESEGAGEALAAMDLGQQARLWESRRCLGKALKALSPEIAKADVVVPRARVPELAEGVKRVGRAHGLDAACFGHAGDGNVHVNLLRGELEEEAWQRVRPAALSAVMDVTAELGGLPSGEHGIGILKKDLLRRFLHPRALDLMRGIKATFDPQGILNPGKIL